MTNQNKQKLFARFVAGVATEGEEQQLLSNPEVEGMMKEQWENPEIENPNYPKPDQYRVLAAIYRRIARKANYKTPMRTLYVRIMAVAAAAAILLSVGTFLWYEGSFVSKDIVTVTAPIGVKAEVFLPDGSRVWLNSGSSITYSKNFDNKTREITLDGEAYFNISHNPLRPLIVKTKTANLEVLGTRFNIVSLPSLDIWEATLISGSVRVFTSGKNSSKSVSLKPGEKAIWSKQVSNFSVQQANTTNITRWVNNQLMFENETFGSIAKQIENTFGVQIEIPQRMSQQYRFTAKFSDESVYEIFNLLKLSAPFNFSIQGNKVIVTPVSE
jgi:transmembrane sensor